LHIVIAMDYSNPSFSINCESNPAFYKECSVLWFDAWGDNTMLSVPQVLLKQFKNELGEAQKELSTYFYEIHSSVKEVDSKLAAPRHYIKLLDTFKNIYNKKRTAITKRQSHLKVIF